MCLRNSVYVQASWSFSASSRSCSKKKTIPLKKSKWVFASTSSCQNVQALILQQPQETNKQCAQNTTTLKILSSGSPSVSLLVGGLSPVNHKGLYQGWKQTSAYLISITAAMSVESPAEKQPAISLYEYIINFLSSFGGMKISLASTFQSCWKWHRLDFQGVVAL